MSRSAACALSCVPTAVRSCATPEALERVIGPANKQLMELGSIITVGSEVMKASVDVLLEKFAILMADVALSPGFQQYCQSLAKIFVPAGNESKVTLTARLVVYFLLDCCEKQGTQVRTG